MGRHKDQIERGWLDSETDKWVCADCVDDDDLKQLVADNAIATQCTYCEKQGDTAIGAAIDKIISPIVAHIRRLYDDPANAGVPYEGEYMTNVLGTADVLMELGIGGHDEFVGDVIRAIAQTAWVPAWSGSWLSSPPSESMTSSWELFSELVKHRVRYLFNFRQQGDDYTDSDNLGPIKMLEAIGHLVHNHNLVCNIEADLALYRARIRGPQDNWDLNAKTMGAPPEERASAGRLNPAGISYLYLALEENTAIAETASNPPITIALAQFRAKRTLRLLNLAELPKLPSKFDDEHFYKRQDFLFLHHFVHAVSQPIRKDGREHISYVPSQIVSEYFAHVFAAKDDEQLDGICYPSSVRPRGINVVLFPPDRFNHAGETRVEMVRGHLKDFETWATLAAAVT